MCCGGDVRKRTESQTKAKSSNAKEMKVRLRLAGPPLLTEKPDQWLSISLVAALTNGPQSVWIQLWQTCQFATFVLSPTDKRDSFTIHLLASACKPWSVSLHCIWCPFVVLIHVHSIAQTDRTDRLHRSIALTTNLHSFTLPHCLIAHHRYIASTK